MNEELRAMVDNKTWFIVPLSYKVKSIVCRWIYTNKMNLDRSLTRHKAQLVAKGYNQKEGVDYIDTFSPVAKLVTVKLLLALSDSQKWTLPQLDIQNAFLNGALFEEVFMDIPQGFNIQGEHNHGQ